MARERILIADDDEQSRHLARTTLEQAGYQVLEASDGAELITTARAHHPQVIIADLLMPGMDAFEPTIELKRGVATQHIPVIYLSTLAPEEARSQGVASFLTKPFERDDLIGALTTVVPPTGAPLILVVDDEPDIIEIVSDYLGDAGYRTLGARDGQEAIQAVERQAPAGIILDVKMPVLDGYGVIRRVKRHPVHRAIPIIILTATKVLRLTDGAPSLPEPFKTIPKPFQPPQLLAAVQEALRGA